jgi:hypothetical protein
MNNTIFYLIGNTAAARLAVAKEIAALTGARVVDTQDIYAPIFNVIEHDRLAELPDAAWAEVDVVRGAVLRAIETLSPKDWSFVFTHAGFDIPADIGVYRTVRTTAGRRGARFLPVTLTAGAPKKLLRFDEADALSVDMSAMSAAGAAKAIVEAAGKPR